jgi:DeoR/GlpR family transcriptional regulator of sugar metabolism
MLESQLKRAMWQQAARRVVLMDSGKFGANKFAAFAAYDDIHIVVSDDKLQEEHRQALIAHNVKVL